MSDTLPSPNMDLPIPVTGNDPGPDYANNVNASLLIVDSHDHSPGKGVPITPGGININADLNFLSNNAIGLRAARFTSQASPIPATGVDLEELYVSGVDLYYNDGSGNQVRITQSGGVAGSPGSIANLTSPASATYVALSQTFVWQSDANVAANMDGGSVIIRKITASSPGITISAPVSLSGNYTITLPAAPPSATSLLQMTNAGTVSASNSITGNVSISGDLSVAGAETVVGTLTVQGVQLVYNGGVNMLTFTGAGIQLFASDETFLSTPGDKKTLLIGAGNTGTVRPAVVSATPALGGLMIVRGRINGATGAIESGEGFTVTAFFTGLFQITFNNSFLDAPVVVATEDRIGPGSSTPAFVQLSGVTTTVATILVLDPTFPYAQTARTITFIAIGERNA